MIEKLLTVAGNLVIGRTLAPGRSAWCAGRAYSLTLAVVSALSAPASTEADLIRAAVAHHQRVHGPGTFPLAVCTEVAPGRFDTIQILPSDVANLGEPTPQRSKLCTHGPDFHSATWCGKEEVFTDTQARVIEVLWEAWASGNAEVGKRYLLAASKSTANRLDDIFDGNPAWGRMIFPGKKRGNYRLADPDEIHGAAADTAADE